jgi:hypothetical protein
MSRLVLDSVGLRRMAGGLEFGLEFGYVANHGSGKRNTLGIASLSACARAAALGSRLHDIDRPIASVLTSCKLGWLSTNGPYII